jgi:HTH-type transcriptional regulator/antitoxin HigA
MITIILTLKIFDMKIIKTDIEYQSALKRLDEIFDASVESKEGDEAELLMLLIENYEESNYSIDAPDPIEAIKFRMEQLGMKKKDLAEILGYKSRVTEILTKKRKLTLKMIRNLHEKMRIPYESLMTDY